MSAPVKTPDQKQAQVDAIVAECHDLNAVNKNGTPTGAWAYLVSRGIDPATLPPDVKIHRRMGKGSIAVLCRDESGDVTGVHLIGVNPDGSPREDGKGLRKRSFGIIKGNAFRFPCEGEPPGKYEKDSDRTPIIAEGFETCASIWQPLDRRREVFAAFGASFIGDVQVPKHNGRGKTSVLVVADADDPGTDGYKDTIRSMHQLIKRGYHVRHARPACGGGGRDANDMLREDGDEAVRNMVRTALPAGLTEIADAVKDMGYNLHASDDAGEPHFLDGMENDKEPKQVPAEPLSIVDVGEMLRRKASEVPRRDMLMKDMLERGKLSLLAGPGGVMKTTLMLAQALAGAFGVPFGPFVPTRKLKSLYCGVEDDKVEIERRIRALLKTDPFRGFKIEDPSFLWETGAFQFVDCDSLLLFERNPESGAIIFGEHYGRLIKSIEAFKPDLLFIDPLVEITEGINENDNAQAHKVMAHLRFLARHYENHLQAAHHFNKPGTRRDAGAARGASAIVNAARYVINLDKPSEDECAAHAIDKDDAHFYVFGYIPKANNSATGVEFLLGIETFDIGNGEHIAAIEPREFSELVTEVTPDVVEKIIADIGTGRVDEAGKPTGDRYTGGRLGPKESRANNLLMTKYTMPKKQADELLKKLKMANRIEDREYVNLGRKPKIGLFAVDQAEGNDAPF